MLKTILFAPSASRLLNAAKIKAKMSSLHPTTLAIHGGEHLDPTTKASTPPLVLSTTFAVEEPLSFSANELNADSPWCYTRWANPTVQALEHKVALLEGVEEDNCVAFASGMAASAATMFSFLKAGDHVIAADVQYPGVAELFKQSLPKFGIQITTVDPSNSDNVQAAVRPNTKMIWIETPSNPILRLADISAIGIIARSAGAELVVDSTFATPMITRPIADHGADFVIHSLSKYLNGHGDAIGGCVVGKKTARVQELRAEGAIHHGGILSPFNAYLISRGMNTLPLRMKQHSKSARRVSAWLATQEEVIDKVFWPHATSHPQYALAKKQMKMGGGMVTFVVKNGKKGAEEMAQRMMKHLKIIHYAVSLGHQRSLVYLLSTHDLAEREGSSYELKGAGLQEYKKYAGEGGVFRLSVGLEDAEDLIRDLEQVFYNNNKGDST